MKGIDTNVLVRYLVQDDAVQSKKAAEFIESECVHNEGILINDVVMCELVWVLETFYEYSKESIVDVLDKIMLTKQFTFVNRNVLWQALRIYQKSNTDFADNYIAFLNHQHNCEYSLTFDKKAAQLCHFKLL